MRLKEDSTSWKSRGIMRRDFRHDPGTPESEIPKHMHGKGKNKKHVHKYVRSFAGWTTNYLGYTVEKFNYTCHGCGNKRNSYPWRY